NCSKCDRMRGWTSHDPTPRCCRNVRLPKNGSRGHKMRISVIIFIVTIGANTMVQEGPRDNRASDLERLQGPWIGVSGEVEGKKMHDDLIVKVKIVFRADKALSTDPSGAQQEYSIKLDSTCSPKRIDFVEENSDGRKTTVFGIYQLNKNGLKLCMSDP